MVDLESFAQAITALGYQNGNKAHLFVHQNAPDVAFVPMNMSETELLTDSFTLIIHEDIWISRNIAVMNRLKALTGNTQRIHGRSCEIKRINRITAENFLNTYHTGGYVDTYFKYGIFYKQELLAAALFAKCRTFYTNDLAYKSSELTRFACKTGVRIAGGLDKLLQHFCLQYQVSHLMTYADKEWTDGKSYYSLGFQKTGETPSLTFWVNKETAERQLCRQNMDVSREGWILKKNRGNVKLELTKNPRT